MNPHIQCLSHKFEIHLIKTFIEIDQKVLLFFFKHNIQKLSRDLV